MSITKNGLDQNCAAVGLDVENEWVTESANEGDSGIATVHVMAPIFTE